MGGKLPGHNGSLQALPGVMEQKGSQTTFICLNHMVHYINVKHKQGARGTDVVQVGTLGLEYKQGEKPHDLHAGFCFPRGWCCCEERVRYGQEHSTDEGSWGEEHVVALSEDFHLALTEVWQLAYCVAMGYICISWVGGHTGPKWMCQWGSK